MRFLYIYLFIHFRLFISPAWIIILRLEECELISTHVVFLKPEEENALFSLLTELYRLDHTGKLSKIICNDDEKVHSDWRQNVVVDLPGVWTRQGVPRGVGTFYRKLPPTNTHYGTPP